MNDVELLDRVLAERPSLPGWCSAEKARKLVETILTFKPALCVEIGVFGGSSLIPQVMAMKHLGQGKVFGIDPWDRTAALEEMKGEANINWWSNNVDLEKIYRICQGHLTRLGLLGHCELIRAKAEAVVNRFGDGSVGLLHIDGNHSEALSLKDAELFLPKVAPGGCIFFDDVSWREKAVWTTRKALTHLLENECLVVDKTGDCSILRKAGSPSTPLPALGSATGGM